MEHTDRNKLSIEQRALEMEVPADLVQVFAVAVEGRCDAPRRLQRRSDLGQGKSLAGVGGDTSLGEPLVRREGLEQCDDLLEERDGFGALRAPTGQAGRLEGAVARAVLAPFVFPELLVLAVDVDPVLVHEVEGVGGSLGGE